MDNEKQIITIGTTVNADINKIWKYWNDPEHVVKWNAASVDWHTPHAENDLSVGSGFRYTMAARDGSFSFDFVGNYTMIVPNETIVYEIADGRKVRIDFSSESDKVTIVETFEAETQNPIEMQRDGWQSILDNFKTYVEQN